MSSRSSVNQLRLDNFAPFPSDSASPLQSPFTDDSESGSDGRFHHRADRERRAADLQTRRAASRRHQRSLTVSPGRSHYDSEGDGRQQRLTPVRHRSDYGSAAVLRKPELPDFARRGRLRKTHSDPADIFMVDKFDRIQNLLESLDRPTASAYTSVRTSPTSPQSSDDMWATPRGSVVRLRRQTDREATPNGSDVISTDIEELKEAAQSIEALCRSTRSTDRRRKPPLPGGPAPHSAPPTASLTRRSGITTRVTGHPRGVMQFLPSVRTSDLLSKSAYETYMGNRARRSQMSQDAINDSLQDHTDVSAETTQDAHVVLRRKVSMPDRFYQQENPDEILLAYERSGLLQSATMGPQQESDLYRRRLSRFSSFNHSTEQHPRGVQRQLSQSDKSDADTLESSFSRFGKLLRSLRTSRQNSPDLEELVSPNGSTGSPMASPAALRTGDFSPNSGLIHKSNTWHLQTFAQVPNSLGSEFTSETPMTQADLLLWRKRSKGSLRKHEVRWT